jgi:hypothetical protein
VVDVSNPYNPVKVGECDIVPLPSDVCGIRVSGDYAYVAAGFPHEDYDSFFTIDVSDPTDPYIEYAAPIQRASDVDIEDGFAYVCSFEYGLFVVDLVDPKTPVIRGSIDLPARCQGIMVEGDFAYVSRIHEPWGDYGLFVVDISDPDNPQLINQAPVPDNAFEVFTLGNWAFLIDWWGGLYCMDISNPYDISLEGHYIRPGLPWDIHYENDTLFVANHELGNITFNVSSPAEPAFLSFYDTPGTATGIDAYSNGLLNYVYSTNAFYGQGLKVFNYSNPLELNLEGELSTFPDDPYEVSEKYPNVFLSLHERVDVVDVSNPGSLTVQYSFTDCTSYGKPCIVGDIAYLPAFVEGMWIYNVADPVNPILLGIYLPLGAARYVDVNENTAYVAIQGVGIDIVDVENPASPDKVGFIPLEEPAAGIPGVTFEYNSVFFVNGWFMYIWDVLEPLAPMLAAQCELRQSGGGVVEIKHNVAYVPNGTCGLRVIQLW